ncbi:ATP-binding cassette domain-containing protein [Pararhizobium haloflavum]|uniref:ATP-binding cassette domain-containing protein n=1 Tax=Pararhizobium haloflavum TaxID=2037914 RepID=UPI0018E43787|nr:ATP-binding cassette domain-containing protein [Pararhizobium haloflavum]
MIDENAMRDAGGSVAPLAVRSLAYAYGRKTALRGIDFTLRPARVTALLGPNGAGKTTLFSLITGLFDSHGGEIVIEGAALRKARSRALANLGIVFQAQTLDLDLTVDQNMRYFAALRGLTRRTARERIDRLLDAIGLQGQQRVKVRNLSGGQRRRVEVARALIDRPRLLLLDEPSTGLDIETRRWLIGQIHKLAHDEGICVLLATHLVDEVAADDDLIVLDEGKIVASGKVRDVVEAAHAASLDEAFTRLTGVGAEPR